MLVKGLRKRGKSHDIARVSGLLVLAGLAASAASSCAISANRSAAGFRLAFRDVSRTAVLKAELLVRHLVDIRHGDDAGYRKNHPIDWSL